MSNTTFDPYALDAAAVGSRELDAQRAVAAAELDALSIPHDLGRSITEGANVGALFDQSVALYLVLLTRAQWRTRDQMSQGGAARKGLRGLLLARLSESA